MSARVQRPTDTILPALLAATALHGLIIVLVALFASRSNAILPMGSPVPINIVSSDTVTNSRPAEVAPETQAAATETPVPEAPPTPPAPTPPTPKPAPPAKAAAPPPPVPAKPAPTPPKPPGIGAKPATAAAKPEPAKPFDLNALQSSIQRYAAGHPSAPSPAKRGPTHAETAPVARVDAGTGVTQSDLQGLQQLLERLWNPNCDVQGGDAVIVSVKFTVGDDGRLNGPVRAGGQESSGNAVIAAAARRAIDAVHVAAPFGPAYRNNSFTVNFNANKACSQR